MEHILQIAIGVDDEAIRKHIEKNAERQIIDKITGDLKGEIFHMDYYNKSKINGLSIASLDILKEFLEEHKDEIINAAGVQLCEYLKRTKPVKDAVARAVQEVGDENH